MLPNFQVPYYQKMEYNTMPPLNCTEIYPNSTCTSSNSKNTFHTRTGSSGYNTNFQNFNSYSYNFGSSVEPRTAIPLSRYEEFNQPTLIQHQSNNTPSRLPSIRELLEEIQVTVRREDFINVATTIPDEKTSLSRTDTNLPKQNQNERNYKSTSQVTTHQTISNPIRIENTNTLYNSNNVDNKGISTFGNKKICKQKSTRYLSETANLILKQWLYDNWHNPYPDQSDKLYLSKLANITVAQVNNYFINARRRVCKKMKNPPSSIHALP